MSSEQNDDLFNLNEKISRRKALSTIGKAAIGVVGVVVIGGVGYYVLSNGQQVPASSSTTSALGIPSGTLTGTAPSSDPVYFVEWIGAVYPDLIKRFNTDFQENANLVTLPGDWDIVMESRFVSGAPADVVQFQGGQGARWRGAGWLMDLNQLPETADYIKDVTPKVAAGSTMTDGSFIGYNYYIDPFILMRNEKVLAQGGYGGDANASSYPKDWDTIFNICSDLKKKGLSDAPYLPTFLNTVYGFPWQFITDCGAEGDDLWDKNLNATFDTSTGAGLVAARYKKFWDAGLIPHGSLTFSLTDLNAEWNSGKYAFTSWLAYEVSTYNDPKNSSIAGYTNVNPTYPGKTGAFKLVSLSWAGISSVGPGQPGQRSTPRSAYKLARINNLLQTVGWKYPKLGSNPYPQTAQGSEYASAQGFFDAFLLGNPFPAFYKNPNVRTAIQSKMATSVPGVAPVAVDWWINSLNNADTVIGFKAVWFSEWQQDLITSLNDLLTAKVTPNQWVTDRRTKWDTLQKQYSK